MRPHPYLLVAGIVLLVASSPARAAHSFDSCTGTIASLPAVISTQGTWCLTSDLATSLASGAAISVNVNNVTIDCNGFKLGGLGAGMGTGTIGVQGTTRSNLVVRNCHFRGFRIGVQGTGSGFRIHDNRLEGSTQRAVSIGGDEHTVRGNIVTDTGGSTIGTGAGYGIVVSGSGDVIENTIGNVFARAGSAQGAWGILVNDDEVPAHTTVAANRIRGVLGDGAGASVAIRTAATGRTTLLDNVAFGNGVGIGLQCVTNTGAVRGNSLLGFATGISGCSSDGANVVKP